MIYGWGEGRGVQRVHTELTTFMGRELTDSGKIKLVGWCFAPVQPLGIISGLRKIKFKKKFKKQTKSS